MTVSAHPQRCFQGWAWSCRKQWGCESVVLSQSFLSSSYPNIYFHGKWAHEINLIAALMQKGSENGTQEIDSLIGSEVNISSRDFHIEFRGTMSTDFCAFPPHFLKQMPGELQFLIIFFHLKIIRCLLGLYCLSPPTHIFHFHILHPVYS